MTSVGKDIFLKPRLRLFLSVDIIGSTALKQVGQLSITAEGSDDPNKRDYATGYQEWAAPIMLLYDFFYADFKRHWDVGIQKMGLSPICKDIQPELWKAVGDELIFTVDLVHVRLALAAVAAFGKTTTEFSKVICRNHPSLGLKASAWIAGFPVTNSEVLICTKPSLQATGHSALSLQTQLMADYYANNVTQPVVRDFIGPSIDTGFRVASHSTSRKMAITVDLAYMLGESMGVGGKYKPPLQIFYDGRRDLKGVLGGLPYPILWVDTSKLRIPENGGEHGESLEVVEDRLLGAIACPPADLVSFCEGFISTARKSHLRLPYIVSPDHSWGDQPNDHKLRLIGLAKEIDSALRSDAKRDSQFQQVSESSEQVGQSSNDNVTANTREIVLRVGRVMDNARIGKDKNPVGTNLPLKKSRAHKGSVVSKAPVARRKRTFAGKNQRIKKDL